MTFSEGAEFYNLQNWHSRGYLPHYEAGSKYQMITYRLADSLPKSFTIPGSAGGSPAEEGHERRKAIEEILDSGYGLCILQKPEVAKIVVGNWKHFDATRYDLKAYVVMPNHVHILVKTHEDFTVSKIVHSWKSYTSKMILNLGDISL
ncbi:MAG: hypothetical protein GY816_10065, partial [Cytophagales bacterium]|nr:hypothetical protein [Cytophagales bacterium]